MGENDSIDMIECVGVLAATTAGDTSSNTMLLLGLALIICGYLAHIFFNKNSKRIE